MPAFHSIYAAVVITPDYYLITGVQPVSGYMYRNVLRQGDEKCP